MRLMDSRVFRAAVLALLAPVLVAPALGQSPATTTAPRANTRSITEAIRLSKDAKRALQELITSMHQVSQQLEKTDPQAARAIATAAAKAEEAFISDDMEKVVRLLQQGLVAPADSTQAQVIARLRQVLETLRSGGDDLLARLIELEKMAQMLEVLKLLIQRQRVLERQTRAIAFADQIDKELGSAMQTAGDLLRTQKDLHARTKQLAIDAKTQELTAAEEPIREIIKRVEALAVAAADPFPSPETMQAHTAACRALSTEVITARVGLKTLFNEPAMAKLIADGKAQTEAAAVDTTLDTLNAELGKVAKAFQADELEAGQTAVAEARLQARDAMARMQAMLAKLPAAAPVLALIKEQEKQQEATWAFDEVLAKVAPIYEKQIGPAASINNIREAARAATQPRAPEQRAEDASIAALRQLDVTTAATEQERLVTLATVNVQRVEGAVTDIAALRKTPNYAAQATQQGALTTALIRLASADAEGAAATQPGQPSKTGTAYTLPTDQQAQMVKASEFSKAAAGELSSSKPAEANREQNSVLRILEEVYARLLSDFQGFAQTTEEELQLQVLAFLQRTILAQKRVSADTIAIYEKRTADGTYKRTEILALSTVSQAQADIKKMLDDMAGQMAVAKASHSLVKFPPICYLLMQLVKNDSEVAAKALAAQDAGPRTQRLQKDMEERLEGIMTAMKGAETAAETPPSWGQNAIGNPEKSKVDRIAEVQMMMVLQGQINRRTQEVEELRKEGKTPPDTLKAYTVDVYRLQMSVSEFVEKVNREDLAEINNTYGRKSNP